MTSDNSGPVRVWMDDAGHLHLTPTSRRKEYVALPAAHHAAREAVVEAALAYREAEEDYCAARLAQLMGPFPFVVATLDAREIVRDAAHKTLMDALSALPPKGEGEGS